MSTLPKERLREWGKTVKPVLICKIVGKRKWMLVSASQGANYKAAQIVLANMFNRFRVIPLPQLLAGRGCKRVKNETPTIPIFTAGETGMVGS